MKAEDKLKLEILWCMSLGLLPKSKWIFWTVDDDYSEASTETIEIRYWSEKLRGEDWFEIRTKEHPYYIEAAANRLEVALEKYNESLVIE